MSKILVADDSEQICRSLERVLCSAGHQVIWRVTVDSAIQSLKLARVDGKPFEVIVADLVFDNDPEPENREMAGMRIVTKALEDPFAEIIMLTGHGTTRTAAQACADGVFRYIEKSGTDDATIRKLLLEVVAEAIQLRKKHEDLATSLHIFSDILSEAARTGLDKNVADRGKEILRKAQEVHSLLLRYRGKHT